eukprot:evm.model.scf_30EXC.8 EVM.evm.TU.scf_30EXC.8   scf_30EXC:116874-133578(-)
MDVECEYELREDAPESVVEALQQFPRDLNVQTAAIRALLSLSGCLTCRSFYDKNTQDVLGGSGAVEALLTAILRLQETAAQSCRRSIADAVQALHYICLMNKNNVARLSSNQGLNIIRLCIEDAGNELTVQEHGCMLLAELACRQDASDQEVIDCVVTVSNVARLQMQEKFIEVARAAVWSLTRIASSALHPRNHQQQEGSWMAGLWQVWPIMQGQALHMILDMMQSCQLKDDPLVKHCLDFIAVVGGDDGGLRGAGPNLDGVSALSVAALTVYQVFIAAQDTRMQAVALRTLYALLSNPQCLAVDMDFWDAAECIFKAMRGSRKLRDPTTKDVLCTQAFGLAVIGKLLDLADEGDSKALKPKVAAPLAMYSQDIHGAIATMVRYIAEGNEIVSFDFAEDDPVVEVSCCRYACHCCFLHEPTKGRDVLASVEGAAVCLLYCGDDALNSTDKDGFTILHRLAEAGLSECLAVYIRESGDALDFLKRTKHGANALQLARDSKVLGCVLVLEKATEAAAKAAQDALLRELEREGGKKEKQHLQHQPHVKKPRKKKGLPIAAGQGDVQEDKKEEKKQKISVQSQEKCAEEKRAKEEQSRKEEAESRRRQEEEYERALEARRRQLEEQEKKMLQQAREASLQETNEETMKEQQAPAAQKGRKSLMNGSTSAKEPKLTPLQDSKSQKRAFLSRASEPETKKVHGPAKATVDVNKQEGSVVGKSRDFGGQTAPSVSPQVQKRSSQNRLVKTETGDKQSSTSATAHAQQVSKVLPTGTASSPPGVNPSKGPQRSIVGGEAQANHPTCTPHDPKQQQARQSVQGATPSSSQGGSQTQSLIALQGAHTCSNAQPPQSSCLDVLASQTSVSTNGAMEASRAPALGTRQAREPLVGGETTPTMPASASSGLPPDQQSHPWGALGGNRQGVSEITPPSFAFTLPSLGANELGKHHQVAGSCGAPQNGGMGDLGNHWPSPSPMSMALEAYPQGTSISEPFPPQPAQWLRSQQSQCVPEHHMSNPILTPGATRESAATEWTHLRPLESGAQGTGASHRARLGAKGAASGPALEEEDMVDDSQIMSWLSSDIAGLILTENGTEKAEDVAVVSGPGVDPNGHTDREYGQPDHHQFGCPWDWWTAPPPPSSPITISSSASNSPLMKSSVNGNAGIHGHGHRQIGIVDDNPEAWHRSPSLGAPGPPLVYPPAPYSSMWAPQGEVPEPLLERGELKVLSKHLWLGNLNTRLPRSILKSVFEEFGPVEDVVTFPGRMYAFVNFHLPEDAARAAEVLDQKEVPSLTGNKKLVIKFRPNRKALGRVGDMLLGMAAEDGRPVGEEGAGGEAAFVPPYGAAMQHQGSAGALPDPSSSHCAPSFHSWDDTGENASPPHHKGGSAEWGGFMPSSRVWLGNISSTANAATIRSVLAKFGSITDVATFPARTGPLRFAFVTFERVADALESYKNLNNVIVPTLTATKQLKMRFKPAREASGHWQQNGGTPDDLEEFDFDGEEPFYPEDEEGNIPEGRPSRHLWLGNVCLRPSKTVLFSLYSRYGPVESVRTFPGKTFAFVNFQQTQHAARAKEALDGEVVTAISGSKPLVVRFQKEGSGPPMWFKVDGRLGTRRGYRLEPSPGPEGAPSDMPSPSPNAAKSWQMEQYAGENGCEEGVPQAVDEMPQLNLSNRLNPNNIHFDSNLANRYNRMSKHEKEALWAEDRAQHRLSETLVNGSRRYMGGQQDGSSRSSALEASSIGDLTRTLSAAALGNSRVEPGMDRATSWGDNMMASHYRGSRRPGMYGGGPGMYGEDYGQYSFPMDLQARQFAPNGAQYRHMPQGAGLHHQANRTHSGGNASVAQYGMAMPGFDTPNPSFAPRATSGAPFSAASDRTLQPQGYYTGGENGLGSQPRGLVPAQRKGHARTPSEIYGSLPTTLMPELEGPMEGAAASEGGGGMGGWGPAGNGAPVSSPFGAAAVQGE